MNDHISKRLMISVCILQLFISQALGETPEELFNLDLEDFLNIEVVSVSKRPEKSYTAPGTLYVITEEDIERYRLTSLEEALNLVPSVYLYNPHSWIWGGQRGFVSNFSQTLLLINGREVNDLIALEGFISNQFGTRNIKRVEVVASPASAMYGANALAGVINIILKDGDPEFKGVELSVDTGSYNTIETNLIVGKKINDISLKGSIRYFESDEADFLEFVKGPSYSSGWVDGTVANSFINDYENDSSAMNINFQVDFKGLYAGMNYYRNEQSHGLEKLRWDYTDGVDEREFSLYFAGFDDRITPSFRLKADYYYIRNFMWGSYDAGLWPVARLQAPNDTAIYTLPDSVTTSTGQRLAGEDEIKAYYSSFAYYLMDQGIIDSSAITEEEIETYFQHVYANKESDGSIRHRFEVMTSTELTERASIDVGYAFDYIDFAGLAVTDAGIGQGASVDIPVDSSLKKDYYTSYKHGIFGQLYYSLIKDILCLNIGARYDDQEHYGSSFNPRIGMVYQPGKNSTIKVLYGESFREPNIFELSSNPDLDPAELKTYELGIGHNFGGFARLNLTGYHSKIDNFLGSVGSLIGTGVEEVETQTVDGIECKLDIKKKSFSLFLNGALIVNAEQKGTNALTGAREKVKLKGLPKETASLGLSYDFLNYYKVSMISSHRNDYEALSGNKGVSDIVKIKAYHDVKVSLSFDKVKIGGFMWDGYISVNNLFDRINYEANIRRSGPHMFIQEGRSYTSGIRMVF